MTSPDDDRRRSPGRREGDDARRPDEDTTTFVSRKVEAAVAQAVRSAALVELADEVRDLGTAVEGYRDDLNAKLHRRTVASTVAAILFAATLVVGAGIVAQGIRDRAELRRATADAVELECRQRRQVEEALIDFIDATDYPPGDPTRREELLELARDTLSSAPCAELADRIANP